MICAICGRATAKPAVMIGTEAIGPACARKAGLLATKPRAGSAVKILKHKPEPRAQEPGLTGDLFEGME